MLDIFYTKPKLRINENIQFLYHSSPIKHLANAFIQLLYNISSIRYNYDWIVKQFSASLDMRCFNELSGLHTN